MKSVFGIIGVCLIAASTAFAQQPTSQQQPKSLQPTQAAVNVYQQAGTSIDLTTCAFQPVPNGYVIVGRVTSYSCGYSNNNAYVVRRPGPREIICDYSPFPGGYIIAGRRTNFSCGGSFNNAFFIKGPLDTDIACKFSPIPSNFQIIGVTTNFECSAEFNNAFYIRRFY